MTSLLLLALAVLLGPFQVCAASKIHFPATFEVDLVFPRNDTYAPTPLFPIVFAFQNTALASILQPSLTLSLSSRSSFNTEYDLEFMHFYPDEGDLLHNDPYYYNLALKNFNMTDIYTLTWHLLLTNCSTTVNETQWYSGIQASSSVNFTIVAGGQKADLVAATAASSSSAACTDKVSYAAINVTSTQKVLNGSRELDSCAVLSEPHPTVQGNPCAVQIDNKTASSISAALAAPTCLTDESVVYCLDSAASGNKSLLLTLDSIEKWATLTLLVSSILVVYQLWI